MTNLVGRVGEDDPPGFQRSFRRLNSIAAAALERWRQAVRSLPAIAASEHGTALRGLVSWYERLCVDERYSNPPPSEGLDALFLVEQERSSSTARVLVAARWAIRVAEELARCRQLEGLGDDEAAMSLQLSRLELALHEFERRGF